MFVCASFSNWRIKRRCAKWIAMLCFRCTGCVGAALLIDVDAGAVFVLFLITNRNDSL